MIAHGTSKYNWNPNAQLTSALIKDGAIETSIHYHYDHKNRLMSRLVSSASGKNRTQFIYDEHKPSLISYCVIDSRIIGFTYDSNEHLIALTIEGTKYYVASDHLGSPVAVYTTEGVLVKEIVRNVWGKIIKDSNPSFWMPVDFRGSIRDPLTGLNYFSDGRVYDPSIGQWLTPNWETFGEDLQNMIHLYRFFNNDPVNGENFSQNFDGTNGVLPMADIDSWLEVLGYRLSFIFGKKLYPNQYQAKFIEAAPIVTSVETETDKLYSLFTHLSLVPESRIKLPFTAKRNDFLNKHEMNIATLPSTLNAVLISRSTKIASVYSVENEKNPIINSVLTAVFNGSYALPFQLNHHSKDEFFFVQQPTADLHQRMQRDMEQLHKLGSLVNVSRVTDTDLTGGSKSHASSHILISTGNLLLNIRYGITYEEELNRVARMARRKAEAEAWQREVFYVRHGLPGLIKTDWNAEERKNLIHSGMVREYFGSNIHNIERYPQLADDSTNIHFKRDNTNILTRKRRNRLRRQKSHFDLF